MKAHLHVTPRTCSSKAVTAHAARTPALNPSISFPSEAEELKTWRDCVGGASMPGKNSAKSFLTLPLRGG